MKKFKRYLIPGVIIALIAGVVISSRIEAVRTFISGAAKNVSLEKMSSVLPEGIRKKLFKEKMEEKMPKIEMAQDAIPVKVYEAKRMNFKGK